MYWHARLMVLAWNILLPLGILIARFYKVPDLKSWPRQLDCKRWWRGHIALQSCGIGIMTLGVLMTFDRGVIGTNLALLHHAIGWCLVSLGWLQVLGGVLRGSKGGPTADILRGDHYDMTGRRILFEYLHKFVGWLTVPLIWAATSTGLWMLNAPRWMAVVLAVWWVGLIVCFVWLQSAGYCIDTYQAIWGPDPAHPGNAREPIGWGVRRLAAPRTRENQGE